MRLDHLNLSVSSFDETVTWYRAVFGFELVESATLDDGTRWGVIHNGGASLCVYEHPEYSSPGSAPTAHHLSHFALQIDDREAWLAAVEAHGIDVRYGGVVSWPHSDSWYVTDPTGWEIEVCWWRDGSPSFAGRPNQHAEAH